MILNSPTISGSLTVTGNILTSGSITLSGSIASSSYAATASFVALAQSASNAVSAQTASFANAFTVAGNLTAQTLVVQTVTSSVIYSSGSNIFGNNIANTQVMTGSVTVTGSLAVVTNGTEFQVTSTGVNLGNALTDSHVISGSLRVNPNGLFVSSSGDVGIGITDLGPTGLSLPATSNYAWSEGSGNAYAVLFRQRNSAATVIASGYKRSNTGAFASSFGTSISRAAIAVGYSNGSIAFFSDSATNVANGTDITPTERMTITNAGNVGIGTGSPYTRFQVNGGNASIQSDSTGSTDGTGDVRRAGFGFRHASADLISALINTTAVADWGLNLHFNTRQFNAVMPATPAMTITAGQNVGIGTTNIGTEANLHLGAFGANEGGQLILQRGTSYASASHLDNYQNRFRVMSGNDTTSTAERMSVDMTNGNLTVYGSLLQGPIITYGASVSPPSPYTADLRLNITHSGWGGNNDSGTVYVEYQGRAYGNNQTTTAFGVITYRLSDNGVSITSVSTAGVTLSNVTLSTDTSTNLVLRITFAVSQAVDRASIFARTTNSFVTSISADTV